RLQREEGRFEGQEGCRSFCRDAEAPPKKLPHFHLPVQQDALVTSMRGSLDGARFQREEGRFEGQDGCRSFCRDAEAPPRKLPAFHLPAQQDALVLSLRGALESARFQREEGRFEGQEGCRSFCRDGETPPGKLPHFPLPVQRDALVTSMRGSLEGPRF